MILALALSVLFADPVVIAAGAGITLAAPTDVSTVHVTGPAVSAGREVVVAWHATTYANKSDPIGKTCVSAKHGNAAVVEIECGAITSVPVVAAGSNGALVVYGVDKYIVGARVVGGKVTKRTFKITNPMTIGLGIGFDGARFWVVYGDGKDAFVQRVSVAGALVGKPEKLPGESPRGGNVYVLCGTICELLTPGQSRSLVGNKLGPAVPAVTDQLWKLRMPTFAAHPFFGADRHRSMPATKDIVGAETNAGALVAWTRRDRSTNPHVFEVVFVPADPTHARHTPIAIEKEIDPVVVALDDTHFVLVSETVGGGNHLVARAVTIDPAYFANVPTSRPPMARGLITGANGKPAAGAKVQYRAVFASGTQRTSSGVTAKADGTYEIPHPAPDDHDPGQDVVTIEVWANDGQEASEVKTVTAGAALDLVLRAPAKVALVLGNANGSNATVELNHLDDISTLRDRRISWQKTVEVSDRLELTDVPAGKLEITARTKDGRAAFVATTITPGKSNPIALPLGRVGSLVVKFDAKQPIEPIAVVQGEDVKNLNNDHSKLVELKDLAPGVHDIAFVSLPWQMTRRYTVRPRATDQAKLSFEADLPPGFVGVQISAALTIEAVAPGSPAERAGMYTGARIDQIDGTAPTDASHARQLLRGAPGTKVTVELGNNRKITIERSRGTGGYAAGGPPDLLKP